MGVQGHPLQPVHARLHLARRPNGAGREWLLGLGRAGCHGQGAGVGARARRAYEGGSGSDKLRQCRPCVLWELQNLGSGAQALRKYACDVNANWETVHVSVKLRYVATFPSIVPHDM
eukprot:1440922-Pleurochrysis_carterae.AAC.4